MPKIALISFNNEITIAKILSKDLIKYRVPGINQTNIFKTNPKKIIERLAKAYTIKPEIILDKSEGRIVNGKVADILLRIEFNELKINVTIFAHSKRRAWRNAAYAVYREYCRKLHLL